jgi:hypothetical protein
LFNDVGTILGGRPVQRHGHKRPLNSPVNRSTMLARSRVGAGQTQRHASSGMYQRRQGESQARKRIPTRGADPVSGSDAVSQQRATGRALLLPPPSRFSTMKMADLRGHSNRPRAAALADARGPGDSRADQPRPVLAHLTIDELDVDLEARWAAPGRRPLRSTGKLPVLLPGPGPRRRRRAGL